MHNLFSPNVRELREKYRQVWSEMQFLVGSQGKVGGAEHQGGAELPSWRVRNRVGFRHLREKLSQKSVELVKLDEKGIMTVGRVDHLLL